MTLKPSCPGFAEFFIICLPSDSPSERGEHDKGLRMACRPQEP